MTVIGAGASWIDSENNEAVELIFKLNNSSMLISNILSVLSDALQIVDRQV
jgi:hypothetical protein